MQYIIVNTDGLITNIVEYDGDGSWEPGDGLTAHESTDGAIGDHYADGVVTPAPVVVPEPVIESKTFEQLVREATSFDELKALSLANTLAVPVEPSV